MRSGCDGRFNSRKGVSWTSRKRVEFQPAYISNNRIVCGSEISEPTARMNKIFIGNISHGLTADGCGKLMTQFLAV